MNDERKQQLLKYTKLSSVFPTLCVILTVLCTGLLCITAMQSDYLDDDAMMLIGGLSVGIILFIILFIYIQYKASTLKKLIDDIEARGELLILLNDFETSGRAFNDSLRVGRSYLIGKGKGTIICYHDIVRIYQYIHKTNSVEDSRALRVQTVENKTIDLCKLPLRGAADDEVMHFFSYIKNMNNNIKLGYRD